MTEQTLCETLRANDFDEAADEIDRLRAALKPFGDAITAAEKEEPSDPEARLLDCFHRLTLYEFGKARDALEQSASKEN